MDCPTSEEMIAILVWQRKHAVRVSAVYEVKVSSRLQIAKRSAPDASIPSEAPTVQLCCCWALLLPARVGATPANILLLATVS